MRKAITVLLSITLIGISILSSTFTVQGSQNEGAWVLVEVIDIDAAEKIAKKTKITKMFIITKVAIAEITIQLHRLT